MSALGMKNTNKYVKRPSGAGAKDVRPAKTTGNNKPKMPVPYQKNAC